MAEFLTTNGTSYHIENIIIEARSKLTLVSPYLQLSKTFYERLKDATNRGVHVTIVYGKDELRPNERNSLAELKNISLFFFENLHAKCYYNETKMVITSMNMYAFSEKNNREMGVLIDSEVDKALYEKAAAESLSIIQSSDQEELRKKSKPFVQNDVSTKVQKDEVKKALRGYCIRCEERINYDSSRPFCTSCFMSWSKYENWSYIENVCHRCGGYEPVSMEKPQCYDCYNLSEYEKDMVLNTSSLPKKLTVLTNNFPAYKITKADGYLYFTGVVPGLDAFIKESEITLKHTDKSLKEPQALALDKKIKAKLHSHQVKLNFPNESYKYWTWDINLGKGNADDLKNLFYSLTAIK
jgi:hypothetical protein